METKHTIYSGAGIQNCLNAIANLDVEKKWDVTIEPHKAKRSGAQNSLYWLWMREISRQADIEGEKYDKDVWHYFCASHFIGHITVEAKGVTHRIPAKSTTKLSVKEFTAYLNEIEAEFLSRGVDLPFPEFYGLAMGKE